MNKIVAAEPKKRELVPVPPQAGREVKAFIPSTIEEIKWEVGLLIEAGLAPSSFKGDPKAITVAVLKGLEVGMPPMMAVSNIAVINGRATIWGDAALALVQSKNVIERMDVEEIGTKPDETAEVSAFPADYGFMVSIWRRGQKSPYVGKYTVGDAKRAKLWMNPSKAPWMQYPKRMLKIRATAFPLRDGFADCLNGLHIREEIEDLPPVPEAKADTSFLDDHIPETGSGALVEGQAVTIADPEMLPVLPGDGGPNWGEWHDRAMEIIRTAPTGEWLVKWRDMHKAALANLMTYSTELHATLTGAIEAQGSSLHKSAA